MNETRNMAISEMTMEIQLIRSAVKWTNEQRAAIDRISDLAREIASRSAAVHNAMINFRGL